MQDPTTTVLTFITAAHLAMVPVTIGLTGVLKVAFKNTDSSRWVPFAAIVIGVGLSILIGGGVVPVIVGGIVVGLMACGLYSTSSTIKNG